LERDPAVGGLQDRLVELVGLVYRIGLHAARSFVAKTPKIRQVDAIWVIPAAGLAKI
jgi:hypothetical protein